MKRLLAAYRLWKTRRELHALSDHMLRDIGLRRDQLSAEFLERAVRDTSVSRGVAAGAGALLSASARVQYSGKPQG
jgi:uncharacterized protein YjiS (DUF1127 family)